MIGLAPMSPTARSTPARPFAGKRNLVRFNLIGWHRPTGLVPAEFRPQGLRLITSPAAGQRLDDPFGENTATKFRIVGAWSCNDLRFERHLTVPSATSDIMPILRYPSMDNSNFGVVKKRNITQREPLDATASAGLHEGIT